MASKNKTAKGFGEDDVDNVIVMKNGVPLTVNERGPDAARIQKQKEAIARLHKDQTDLNDAYMHIDRWPEKATLGSPSL
ncbi:hypothetical protein LTR27_011576 [Elasticomyces elasticus]|nr:hypothetical protein LTR27_011576 [Elasticomyces elasticus]